MSGFSCPSSGIRYGKVWQGAQGRQRHRQLRTATARLAGVLDRRDNQAQTGGEVATIAGSAGEGEVEPPSALEVDAVEQGAQKRKVVAAEFATAFTQQTGLRTPRTATAPRRHAGIGHDLARHRRYLCSHHLRRHEKGVPQERYPHYRRIIAMS